MIIRLINYTGLRVKICKNILVLQEYKAYLRFMFGATDIVFQFDLEQL